MTGQAPSQKQDLRQLIIFYCGSVKLIGRQAVAVASWDVWPGVRGRAAQWDIQPDQPAQCLQAAAAGAGDDDGGANVKTAAAASA